MKTTVNFLEAVKALSEGKCKEIINETGTPYRLNEEGLVSYCGKLEGIKLYPSAFLGKWKLVGVKQKIVIEDVVWVIGQRDCVYPDNPGKRDFYWQELLNKPKMKMTLEWVK